MNSEASAALWKPVVPVNWICGKKAARADYVYENAGSLDELEHFVAAVVADLT